MDTTPLDFASRTEAFHAEDASARALGISSGVSGPGWCETQLGVGEGHRRSGGISGGVLAGIAEYTAGAAAYTLIGEQQEVRLIEIKLSALRPPRGESLRCRAQVLTPGTDVMFIEAEVYAMYRSQELMIAKASVSVRVRDRDQFER